MANVSISQLPVVTGQAQLTDLFLMSRPNPPLVGGYVSYQVTAAQISGALNNNVTVTGGTIDGTVIGGTTPAAGTFTNLIANTSLTVNGSFNIGTITPLTIAGNPNFSGTPTFSNPLFLDSSTATTQLSSDNSAKIATTAYVQSVFAGAGILTSNNTWTGTNTFNNTVSGTGITALFASPPAIGGTAAAAGTFTTLSAGTNAVVTGNSVAPTMAAGTLALGGAGATFAANGEAQIRAGAASGLVLQGQGSSNDINVLNSAGTAVLQVATGTTLVGLPGTGLTTAGYLASTGTTLPTAAVGTIGVGGLATNPTLSGSGEGAVYLGAAAGLIAQGSGSSFDVSIKNKSGVTALAVPTGTTTVATAGALGLASIAAPATAGYIWNDSTQNTLGSYENGIIVYKAGLIYAARASQTTSGTGASTLLSATAVGTLTLPANFLVAGKTLKISVTGVSTTQATQGTIVFTLALGGTTVAVTASAQTLSPSLTNQPFGLVILLTCQTTGSSGTVFANTASSMIAATAAVWNAAAPSSTAATTINTTTTQAITLTSTNSVSGGTVFTISNATVEVIA